MSVIVHIQDTFLKNCDAELFCQFLKMLHTSLYIFSNSNISVVAISLLQWKDKLNKQDKQVNRRTKISKTYGYESL